MILLAAEWCTIVVRKQRSDVKKTSSTFDSKHFPGSIFSVTT